MSCPLQVELIMDTGPAVKKLYQQIARQIAAAIAGGRYAPGDKLPSERELADDLGVSRPTIRDAMIALEFQGLVEARQGSGVYVSSTPQDPECAAEPQISALELVEALRLFEGEACALAAVIITAEQLALLDGLATHMAEDIASDEIESLEQEFHLAIARDTGNAAIEAGVSDLWALRQQSPLCAATLRRARVDSGTDFAGEHRKIAAALRGRDPKAARQAIHGHLAQIINDLLALAESDAVELTRQKMAEQRRLLTSRTDI
jgi:GntR family hexuronate regulon transcriptional repressor